MGKLITILYALLVIAHLAGCVIGTGTVNINSPQGQDISVDKAVSTDAEIDIPLIP